MSNSTIDTVQIYLKKDDCYLLLYRNKKKNDINEGKWIGVGGKREIGETIDKPNVTYLITGLTSLFLMDDKANPSNKAIKPKTRNNQ